MAVLPDDTTYVGAIVHYTLPNRAERPAIIVALDEEVQPGLVDLQLLTDGEADGYENRRGILLKTNVPYDETLNIGTWHFIPPPE